MKPENAERLGQMADGLDAILYSSALPLPAEMHLEQFKLKVREARDLLAEVVKDETGDDPWATNPLQG